MVVSFERDRIILQAERPTSYNNLISNQKQKWTLPFQVKSISSQYVTNFR